MKNLSQPRLACLCPTYKRPNFLASAAACFDRQTYPSYLRRLFILDDAGQHKDESTPTIRIYVHSKRYPSLPIKYNKLVELATDEWSPDAFVVWEDDDAFLPWHLQSIADAIALGGEYLISRTIHTTSHQPIGKTLIERSDGRFHSSWAFTADLLDRIGGYPDASRLDFDQQLGSMLRNEAGERTYYSHEQGPPPSYVYRWGNNIYHGSQRGEEGFKKLWDDLDNIPAPYIGRLVPNMDKETELIYKEHKYET